MKYNYILNSGSTDVSSETHQKITFLKDNEFLDGNFQKIRQISLHSYLSQNVNIALEQNRESKYITTTVETMAFARYRYKFRLGIGLIWEKSRRTKPVFFQKQIILT